jgi:hypothetical protein
MVDPASTAVPVDGVAVARKESTVEFPQGVGSSVRLTATASSRSTAESPQGIGSSVRVATGLAGAVPPTSAATATDPIAAGKVTVATIRRLSGPNETTEERLFVAFIFHLIPSRERT